MKKVPFKQLLFSVMIIALITSCKKNSAVQAPDFKRQELMKEVSVSLVRTSVFLKENYDKESFGTIGFFNGKNIARKTNNAFTAIHDQGRSLIDIHGAIILDSLLQSSVNLLEYDGIYDSLVAELGTDPSNIIVSAMALIANEVHSDEIGVDTYLWGDVTRAEFNACILEAFGLGMIAGGIATWGFAGKTVKTIVGMVAKVAARFIGPIGVGWAIWSFADCLIDAM
jgi:hypothetical protein